MANRGKSRTQERAAQLRAAQAEAAAASQRRRTALTTIGIVAALIAALVLAKVAAGTRVKSGKKTASASAAVVQAATHVPVSVLGEVGAGKATAGPRAVSGQPVADVDGKPTVLFVGAEWCPYCATERWPMVVALSRFGTFGPLKETHSSPSDAYPDTATFSMHGVSYTSQYLSLIAKELQSNQASNGNYTRLDTLTGPERSLFKKGGGGYPYLNLAGRYLVATQYDPAVLKGKSAEQIAAALSDPTAAIAQGVDGAANLLTAGLCKLTNNQPTAVCTARPIPALASQIQ